MEKIQPNSSIGKMLKRSREERNILLKHIAYKTKVNLTLLEYLEQDNFKQLPNKIYIIGFIKAYVKVLGIDEKESLDLFHQTYNSFFTEDKNDPEESSQKVQDKSINYLNPTIFLGGSALATIFVFIGIFLFTKEKQPNTEPTHVDSSKQIPSNPQIISATIPLNTKKNDPFKHIHHNDEVLEKPTNEEQEFSDLIKNITFRRMSLAPLYDVLHDDPHNDISHYLPDTIKQSVIEGKQNVFIRAITGDSWLTYMQDRSKIKQMLLKKGNSLMIQGDEIHLFLGNVNATKIFLNNLPLHIQSRTGVKSLIFPQNRRSLYQLPLFIFKDDGTVIPSDKILKQIKNASSGRSSSRI